jgi:hypothetical protein
LKSILGAIRKNTTLKRLEMYRMQDLHPAELIESIHSHSSLLYLSTTLDNLDHDVVKAIEELSRSSQSKLRTLKLCIRGVWRMIDSLPSNGRFRYSLEVSTAKYKRLASLGKALVQNESIESLNLAHNGLTDNDISVLASMLAEARGLQHLSLHGNSIEKKGGQALLLAMQSNHQLESLELPIRCEPHADQIRHYADMNKGGRRLFLDSNASASLWPLVIEKAGRIVYNRTPLARTYKENEARRANVIYHLLHGPATLH